MLRAPPRFALPVRRDCRSRMASHRLQTLFVSFGDADYIGEPVSVTQHCLQAAALAAAALPDDEEYIAAALLHDTGHLLGAEAGFDAALGMDGCGVPQHERLGSEFLRALGLPSRVCELVGHHVDAKRFLTARQPEYLAQLSEASRTTLRHQGGPFSEAEAAAFEASPLRGFMLSLRRIDEEAKVKDKEVPPFSHYLPMLDRLSGSAGGAEQRYQLSPAQLQAWQRDGCLLVPNLLTHLGISPSQLAGWVSEVSSWPKGDRSWLHHYELAQAGKGERVLCRTENFLDFHPSLGGLCQGPLLDAVSQLFGEQASLFKEKINYKPPGGAGFAAHQDTPAYIGMGTEHVSVMLAIDPAPRESGCLQVAKGVWGPHSGVPLTPTGCVQPDAEAAMSFEHIEAKPGDVLFFSGWIPHRSDANASPNPRRAAFITFNRAREGHLRAAYYAAKHEKANGFDGAATVSFQGDFQGIVVE